MKIGKKSLDFILMASLFLGVGCDKKDVQYQWQKNDEQLVFERKFDVFESPSNFLTVVKKDGRIIKYIDQYKNDFKIESLEVTDNGFTKVYTKEGMYTFKDGKLTGGPEDKYVSWRVLGEGQKQIDSKYKFEVERHIAKEQEKKAKEAISGLK